MTAAEKKKSIRMTASEALTDMRKRGYPISQRSFNACVDKGIFPFAVVLNVGATGRRTIHIMRKAYEEWADNNIGGYINE